MFFDKIKKFRLSSDVSDSGSYRVMKLVAKQTNKSTYNGKPCKLCSATRRYVINNNCTACVSRKQRLKRCKLNT
jgi:hypothetical protein